MFSIPTDIIFNIFWEVALENERYLFMCRQNLFVTPIDKNEQKYFAISGKIYVSISR